MLDGYKDTEIGVIPVEWDVAELGHNSSLMTNGFVGTATSFYTEDDNGVVYIQGFNVQNNSFRLTNIKKITQDFNQKNKKSILKQGDLLTVQTGHIGTTAVVSQSLENSNCHALIITRLEKSKLEPYFVSYYINSAYGKKQVRTIQVGTTMLHINVKDYLKYKVPLPPLKEQEKIADILSTADEKIDTITTQIEKAETLKKGLLQKLLSKGIGHSEFKDSELGRVPESWDVVKLKTCSELIKDGTHGSHKDTENGIPLLSAKDIKNGKVILDIDSRKISLDDFNKIHKNYSLTNDDLLLTVVGTLGRVALINEYNNNYTFQRSVAIIRLLKTNSPRYFYHIFNSVFFQKQLILHSNASAQAGVYLGELEKLKIQLPPLEEQKQIADILSTADEKLEVLRAKKEKYETLKKGLLQKLLSGEVRV